MSGKITDKLEPKCPVCDGLGYCGWLHDFYQGQLEEERKSKLCRVCLGYGVLK